MVTLLVVLSIVGGLVAPAESAVVICRKGKKKILLRIDQCRRKETRVDATELGVVGPPGANGLAGAQGPPGVAGADGQLRIYGDGSTGARVITADEDWSDAANIPLNLGGGTLTVLAATSITNNDTVHADGDDAGAGGEGGAGGGVVILASAGSVTNGGTITADGGDGDGSDVNEGPGGGGGGGIVHLIAPAISDTGTVSVAGGSPGATAGPGSVTATLRSGGGGGGACGGSGGIGGAVSATDDPGTASNGVDGWSLQTVADPTALF